MYKVIYIIILFFVSSCMTPQEALDKKQFNTAFRKASIKLERGKDIDANIKIIRTAGDRIVEKELDRNSSLVRSNVTSNLLKVQNRYYVLLEKLGETNIELDGVINGVYDRLCTAKKDLDFQIVDNFYQAGENLMYKFDESGKKLIAREAYAQFKDCKKYEGDMFFNDLTDLLNESHEKGTVYYIGSDYGSSFFFKKLPRNADFDPDCDIDVQYGPVYFYETETPHIEDYTESVEIGRNAVTDTSGNVTYEPIYQNVSVTVRTIDVTVTASRDIGVDIVNVTGQCNVESRNYTSSASDDYQIVEIYGDHRALPAGITASHGSCSRSWLRLRLDGP